jgi:two-component system sensor histidine kinase/response regulator
MRKNNQQGVGIRMLLIEDDVEGAEAMTLTLRKLGVSVTTVATGEQGVEEWRAGGHDVVVSDIRLGSMDGVAVLRAIREQDADFPVLLLTAYEQIDTAIEALRLGAQDYVVKPVTHVESFMLAVRKAVDHHRLLIDHRAMSTHLKALTMQLIRVEESERRRLATSLHDTLSQSLAATKMKVENIVALSPSGKVQDLAQQGCDLLGQVLQQTRFLIFDLSPPILYDLGLAAALDSLVVHMRKAYGVSIHYSSADMDALPGRDASVVLYRSARELLWNAVKYAQAMQIGLSLVKEQGAVLLSVSDNGIGFDVPSVTSNQSDRFGYGLFSIREQLESINGSMDIQSQQGKGTRILIRVAMEKDAKGKETPG